MSLENVITDIHELDKGMELSKRECELGMKHSVGWQLLSDFVGDNEPRLSHLQKEQRIAVQAFSDAAEYFGESQRTIQPKEFFTSVLRFTKAFRAADEENQHRLLKLREAASVQQSPSHAGRIRSKKNQVIVNDTEKSSLIFSCYVCIFMYVLHNYVNVQWLTMLRCRMLSCPS